MPSVRFQVNGYTFQCDSSDPVVIARFLLEKIELASPGKPSDLLRIEIYPMYVRNPAGGRDIPDWPGTRTDEFGLQARDLRRLSQYIMAWQGEREEGKLETPVTET